MPAAGSVWLRPERGSRGPVSGLSRQAVAQAGIVIADRDGLRAVTMRSVANSLKTAAASLYRVVASRDQLLELMTDATFKEFDYSAPVENTGVQGLLRLGRQARDIYRRHPWLLQVPTDDLSLGPNALDFLELSLSALARSNMSSRRKLETVGIASGFVKLLAAAELQTRDRLAAEWQEAFSAYMHRRVTDASHPHVARALSTVGSSDASDPFDRVLRRVLTGLVSDEP